VAKAESSLQSARGSTHASCSLLLPASHADPLGTWVRFSCNKVDIEGDDENIEEALLYKFRLKDYPTETNGVAATKVWPRPFSVPVATTRKLTLRHVQEGLIYAACGDNMVHIWDTETEQHVGSLQGHADYVHCVTVTNDGNQVISGGEDGTVRLWGTCLRRHSQTTGSFSIDLLISWGSVTTQTREHASRGPYLTQRCARACP
jgi:WD40 repeat protein